MSERAQPRERVSGHVIRRPPCCPGPAPARALPPALRPPAASGVPTPGHLGGGLAARRRRLGRRVGVAGHGPGRRPVGPVAGGHRDEPRPGRGGAARRCRGRPSAPTRRADRRRGRSARRHPSSAACSPLTGTLRHRRPRGAGAGHRHGRRLLLPGLGRRRAHAAARRRTAGPRTVWRACFARSRNRPPARRSAGVLVAAFLPGASRCSARAPATSPRCCRCWAIRRLPGRGAEGRETSRRRPPAASSFEGFAYLFRTGWLFATLAFRDPPPSWSWVGPFEVLLPFAVLRPRRRRPGRPVRPRARGLRARRCGRRAAGLVAAAAPAVPDRDDAVWGIGPLPCRPRRRRPSWVMLTAVFALGVTDGGAR